MSTMSGNLRRTFLAGVVGLVAVGAAGTARADVASDQPGAILIFPKIVVDTQGKLGPSTDTEIQITNTSNALIAARCNLVDATSHCSNSPTTACTAAGVATGQQSGFGGCPPGGYCQPGWTEIDFKMTLTKRQPVGWKASEGLSTFPCDNQTGGPPVGCPNGASNTGSDGSPSRALAVQEDPFVGELKCVEVDPGSFKPTIGFNSANNHAGDLKGEATIIAVENPVSTASQQAIIQNRLDARKYNAVGLQSTGLNNNDDVLQVGGAPTIAEYNGCPKTLLLDHLFDDAVVTTHDGNSSADLTTSLTVVPCGEDFLHQTATTATLQFLVFNEFEQRFSTSTSVPCFREVQLSDIDTRPGPFGNQTSIFNVNVQGTLAGLTRIRPVPGATADNRVVAISEQFFDSCTNGPDGVCSTAGNLHLIQGVGLGDQIILAPQ